MQKVKSIEPVYIDNIPFRDLSIAQQATYQAASKVNTLFLMWSRQIGKSNLLSYIFWDRVINTSKRGELYLTMSPREGDIKSLMIDDILLEAFGGKDHVYDINAVYIIPPHDWWLDMQNAFQKDASLLDYWKNNNWLRENNDQIYVKLMIEDLSNSGNGKKSQLHFGGTLFTGADILCVAANHNLNKTVRGRKIKGVYGEEMGEYTNDPFGPILPSVLGQDGWMIYAGTPNESNPFNWVYEKYNEVVNSPYCLHKFKFGVDFYKSTVESDIPASMEDILEADKNGEIASDTITQITLWCIADIEKIFPYVYKGNVKFARVQAQRKNPHKVIYEKNALGQHVYDADKNLKFTIVATGIPNPTGLLDDEKYQREYRVKFSAGQYTAFSEFSREINVIDSTKFNPDNYFSIAGYDHGIKDEKITGVTADGKVSASCWAKIACIPVPQTQNFQYVIYEVGYITDPTAHQIATKWHELLLDGTPIISENALWRSTIKGAEKAFNQILNSHPYLKEDYRAHTGRGIFQCFKRGWGEKFSDLNSWFREDSFVPYGRTARVPYIHPIDSQKKGRKLFITSDCIELINYFASQIIVLDSQNQYAPKKMRDDLYDAATYAIDVMEYKPATVKAIQEYWAKNKNWPRYDQVKQRTNSMWPQLQPNFTERNYSHKPW